MYMNSICCTKIARHTKLRDTLTAHEWRCQLNGESNLLCSSRQEGLNNIYMAFVHGNVQSREALQAV